jgi:hypothetical protein
MSDVVSEFIFSTGERLQESAVHGLPQGFFTLTVCDTLRLAMCSPPSLALQYPGAKDAGVIANRPGKGPTEVSIYRGTACLVSAAGKLSASSDKNLSLGS